MEINPASTNKVVSVKRSSDFSYTGQYTVVMSTGKKYQIYRDPEHTNWYLVTRANSDRLLSVTTKIEALKYLEEISEWVQA